MPAKTDKQILVHGHRGARGLFPENTLTAFRETVNLGAPSIELDVVISADSQVVVSHEPWMHALYCSTPDGKPVKKGKKHNLYKMKYAAIRKYDCGIRGNRKFPLQEKISEHKPLLSEVITELEKHTAASGLNPVTYNIEIKCLEPGDGRFHPKPEKFAKLVYAVISRYNINDRILVQSFDLRVLQEIHKLDSSLRIGILTMTSASVKRKVKKLGFTPYMFNPHYKRVSPGLVKEAHSLGIEVHPYTVNDTADMRRLIRMGVDGLITDFPDKALNLLKNSH
ncbi:MAG: glycerophosphoryl diester phosphodiesterase [Bacteroidetes bacterium]|nr:MAG: glycerophosphoryl diester phosphodiesterase [Bacteroidota bacterium]